MPRGKPNALSFRFLSEPGSLDDLLLQGFSFLLVVLLGRDRVRPFPWFTAAMVMMALRMVASRLLFGRLSPIVSSEVFLVMSDIASIIALLVVVEMARRSFAGRGAEPG